MRTSSISTSTSAEVRHGRLVRQVARYASVPEIRLATPDDAAAVAAIYAPTVTDSAISFESVPPSAEEMRGRISTTLSFTPWLVCVSASDVIAYAYASKHRNRTAYQWSVEVSAYVGTEHRGRRIGAALYTSLFDILRLQGFRNAYAGIMRRSSRERL